MRTVLHLIACTVSCLRDLTILLVKHNNSDGYRNATGSNGGSRRSVSTFRTVFTASDILSQSESFLPFPLVSYSRMNHRWPNWCHVILQHHPTTQSRERRPDMMSKSFRDVQLSMEVPTTPAFLAIHHNNYTPCVTLPLLRILLLLTIFPSVILLLISHALRRNSCSTNS